MPDTGRPFAVVTGASSGIGYELAKQCLAGGFDVMVCAEDARIHEAARSMGNGGKVEAVQADLSGEAGVNTLYQAIGERRVDALLANAGRGLGKAFLDQNSDDWRQVIDTNITGTLLLIYKVGSNMRAAGSGRILITGSIAGFMPGTFQAVYNGTKAFLDSFSFALRHELMGTGVTVTCLMPGATETDFFEVADMEDTNVGSAKKDDPAMVADVGFKAMMKGQGDVVAGWHNKLQAAIAHLAPAGVTAELHRQMAKPSSSAN